MLLPGTARNASAIPTHGQAPQLGKPQKAQMTGDLTLSETQRGHRHTSGSALSSRKTRIGDFRQITSKNNAIKKHSQPSSCFDYTQHCYKPVTFFVFIPFPPNNPGEGKRRAQVTANQTYLCRIPPCDPTCCHGSLGRAWAWSVPAGEQLGAEPREPRASGRSGGGRAAPAGSVTASTGASPACAQSIPLASGNRRLPHCELSLSTLLDTSLYM